MITRRELRKPALWQRYWRTVYKLGLLTFLIRLVWLNRELDAQSLRYMAFGDKRLGRDFIPIPCKYLLMLLFGLLVCVAQVRAASDHAVSAIADNRLLVVTASGQGKLPLYLSVDWAQRMPDITRVLLVIHGALRNADTYLRAAREAVVAAGTAGRGTLLVVPQFLTELDHKENGLPDDILRWSKAGWMEGQPAKGPAPISSFDAIDTILLRLANAQTFPNLRHVIIAGHSAGAQLVQRYAVVGRGADTLARVGIGVRYVVANPSSYLWFGEARPLPVTRATCAGFDRWKYGLLDTPPYVEQTEGTEENYIARDVVYLLGEADNDPNHPLLDKSCAAEAQGANRYERGMNYLFSLELRHPNLVRHRIASVWNVGHDAARMFRSPCGLAALFDRPGCLSF